MDYITRHHHKIIDQTFDGLQGTTAILVEPEAEVRAFYSQQLMGQAMNVLVYDKISALKQATQIEQPDVLIINPAQDVAQTIRVLKTLRQEFPKLPIITMTLTIPDSIIDVIMESGVSFHINRGLTKPRDLLLALQQVLREKQI